MSWNLFLFESVMEYRLMGIWKSVLGSSPRTQLENFFNAVWFTFFSLQIYGTAIISLSAVLGNVMAHHLCDFEKRDK